MVRAGAGAQRGHGHIVICSEAGRGPEPDHTVSTFTPPRWNVEVGGGMSDLVGVIGGGGRRRRRRRRSHTFMNELSIASPTEASTTELVCPLQPIVIVPRYTLTAERNVPPLLATEAAALIGK